MLHKWSTLSFAKQYFPYLFAFTVLDDEVQSKDFSIEVLKPMAIHWFDFGLKLGIDETQLGNLMPANAKNFFIKMLNEWWRQTIETERTWNKIVSALDAVKLNRLAKRIYDNRIKKANNVVD